MNGIINLWKIESYLYAWIDAEGMRTKHSIKKTFCLGNNHFLDVKINNFTNKPLSNSIIIKTKEFVLSLNFRKNKKVWFRIDNESKDKTEQKNYLHFHKDEFNQHQKLEEKYRLSELISFIFDWTYNILKENFPNEIIRDSSGFVGCT